MACLFLEALKSALLKQDVVLSMRRFGAKFTAKNWRENQVTISCFHTPDKCEKEIVQFLVDTRF